MRNCQPNTVVMLRGKAQALRAMKTRVQSEGQFCSYSHRTCMQNRLKDSEYCLKHVLEDKNSLFKQCSFVSGKNGKRCPNAAPKSDRKEGLCLDHAKKAAILRQKAMRKRKPRETSESLLEELAQHRGPGSVLEPVLADARKSRLPSDSLANKVLDYASSSDTDTETTLVDQAWRGDGDSDGESIDSEHEDPLKHAGVYTAEETTLILRDKLIRLQSLYIDQFKRLQHVLKEKRRKYLHSYRQERDTLGSVKLYKNDPEQKEKYQKLKALKRYHRRYGKEALLHRSCKQRRIAVSEGAHYKPPSYPKCIYSQSTGKCNARTIPLSKYCRDHILSDSSQVLFKPCRFADGMCGRPVAGCTDTPLCTLHTQLMETEPHVFADLLEEQISVTETTEEMMDHDVENASKTRIASLEKPSKNHSATLESMLKRPEPLLNIPPFPVFSGVPKSHETANTNQGRMDTS